MNCFGMLILTAHTQLGPPSLSAGCCPVCPGDRLSRVMLQRGTNAFTVDIAFNKRSGRMNKHSHVDRNASVQFMCIPASEWHRANMGHIA